MKQEWDFMFLLSKLDKGAYLFPQDVETVREFLLDRGIPASSMEALTHFSARLETDPSFQRDVTSLVQVVIQREDETVDYMDLLGILVSAAAGAGPFQANVKEEESVREILRFLTRIRRPTGAVVPVFVRSHNVVPLAAGEPLTGERTPLPVLGGYDVLSLPVSSVPSYLSEDSKLWRRRGAAGWIAGGMVLAVALVSGWMLYQKGHATPQTLAVLRAPFSNSPDNESDEHTTGLAKHFQKLPVPVTRKPVATAARHSNSPRAPLGSPVIEGGPPVDSLRNPEASRGVPTAKPTSPARSNVIAESDAVAGPLDAAPDNPAADTRPSGNSTTASTPSIRRRLPKSIMLNPPLPRRPSGSAESLNASAQGVVHPASIGIMASNLISSPAPSYPSTAAQAQVQGEVMVRAVVDRDGNVIDARVVSGPELLRDVSLEAVQHWRFRPYMQGGKPVEVATTAVLDFELP
jgi:TonB family protein